MEIKMKTIAIVQARMGSTRLPGKVLADIHGIPMLKRLLDRVQSVPSIHQLVVATTLNPEDDALEQWLVRQDYRCYRGSENDVLGRFAGSLEGEHADLVVRVTADDPLKDPGVIEQAINICRNDPAIHYCSNTLKPTYPEGLDIEVIRVNALLQAHREASLSSEREHVTPYIWKNADKFRIQNFEYERNLSHWRWTVDKPEDLEFVRAIYAHFITEPLVAFSKIAAYIEEQPALLEINAGTIRNEGYFKSLIAESA